MAFPSFCVSALSSFPKLSPTSNSAAGGKLQLTTLKTTCILVAIFKQKKGESLARLTGSRVGRELEFVFNSARMLELPGSCSSDDARIVYKHRGLVNTFPSAFKTAQDVLVELVPLTTHDLNLDERVHRRIRC